MRCFTNQKRKCVFFSSWWRISSRIRMKTSHWAKSVFFQIKCLTLWAGAQGWSRVGRWGSPRCGSSWWRGPGRRLRRHMERRVEANGWRATRLAQFSVCWLKPTSPLMGGGGGGVKPAGDPHKTSMCPNTSWRTGAPLYPKTPQSLSECRRLRLSVVWRSDLILVFLFLLFSSHQIFFFNFCFCFLVHRFHTPYALPPSPQSLFVFFVSSDHESPAFGSFRPGPPVFLLSASAGSGSLFFLRNLVYRKRWKHIKIINVK